MFDDNVVKMKKEQFIEAESVAYLIDDEQERKLAFANTCVLFVFKNYIEKNKYKYEPVTNINLFRVPAVASKYGISDLYLGDIRVDVRVSLDGKVFPIPKCHIADSLAPDYYVVYKGTKNPLKCEGLGYIKKEDLVFDLQDEKYYYISVAILNPLSDFKEEVNNYNEEPATFYETEHKIASENFISFLDGELDEIKSLDLIKHLLQCGECRGKFVEYSFLEDVLTAVKYYPEFKEDLEAVFEKQAEQEEISFDNENSIEVQEDNLIIDSVENVEPIEEESEITDLSSDNFVDDNELNDDDLTINGIDVENSDFVQDSSQSDVIDFSEEIGTDNQENDIIDLSDSIQDIVDDSNKITDLNDVQYESIDSISNSIEMETDSVDNIVSTDSEQNEIDDISFADMPSSPINEISDNIVQGSAFDDGELTVPMLDIVEEDNTSVPLDEKIDFVQNDKISLFDTEDNQNSTMELDSILDSNIDISQDAKENLQKDEELQKILGTDSQPEATNWNELFVKDSVPKDTVDTEAQSIFDDGSAQLQDDTEHSFSEEDIGTLFNKSNIMDDSEPVVITADTSQSANSNKAVGASKIIVSAIILLSIAAGGFLFIGNGGGNTNPDNTGNIPSIPSFDDSEKDMNQAMTDAFSDNQSTLEITKIQWNKSEKLVLTPELKDYLMTTANVIKDELNMNILSVSANGVTNPVKIIIKINNDGEIKDIKLGESCGSKEVDDVILQTVKTVMNKMTPASYSITGEAMNLVLVVNF